jgi:hypothetical protein
MKQQNLFEQEQDHKGIVYNPKYDYKRLKKQIERVLAVMVSHDWITLSGIASKTGDPEASISARLRALRTEEHGFHTIMKRPRGKRERGLWEYKLVKNTSNEIS